MQGGDAPASGSGVEPEAASSASGAVRAPSKVHGPSHRSSPTRTPYTPSALAEGRFTPRGMCTPRQLAAACGSAAIAVQQQGMHVLDSAKRRLSPKTSRRAGLSSSRSGELKCQCANDECKQPLQGAKRFVPAKGSKHRARFFDALMQYNEAVKSRDAGAVEASRLVLEAVRAPLCDVCRVSKAVDSRRGGGSGGAAAGGGDLGPSHMLPPPDVEASAGADEADAAGAPSEEQPPTVSHLDVLEQLRAWLGLAYEHCSAAARGGLTLALACAGRLSGLLHALGECRARLVKETGDFVEQLLAGAFEILDAGFITLLFLAALFFLPLYMAAQYLQQLVVGWQHAGGAGGSAAALVPPPPPPPPGFVTTSMEELFALAEASPLAYFVTQFSLAATIGVWFLYLDDMNRALARWKAERSAAAKAERYQALGDDDVEGGGGGPAGGGAADAPGQIDVPKLKREFHKVIDMAEELEIKVRASDHAANMRTPCTCARAPPHVCGACAARACRCASTASRSPTRWRPRAPSSRRCRSGARACARSCRTCCRCGQRPSRSSSRAAAAARRARASRQTSSRSSPSRPSCRC